MALVLGVQQHQVRPGRIKPDLGVYFVRNLIMTRVHPVGCVSWSVLKGAFALKIMNSTLTMISVKDAGSVPMNARQKQSPWKRRRNR
jgi:hypothetical protein